MKNIKSIIFLLAIIIGLTSCEKVLEIDESTVDSRLVIEAAITNGPGPYSVKLSNTIPLTTNGQTTKVTSAQVIIADNAGTTDTLTHMGNGVYNTKKLRGVEGRTYTLRVSNAGKSYEAKSTMPTMVKLDSLKKIQVDFGPEKRTALIPVYRDPTTLGNNYHFVMTVNGKKDKSYIVWNDNTSNGEVNRRPYNPNDLELVDGDEVQIEIRCVDQSNYLYLFTLQNIDFQGPGGGTTPSNPPSNISGDALGFFSAYASDIKTRKL